MSELLTYDAFIALARKRYPFLPLTDAQIIAKKTEARLRTSSYLPRAVEAHARHWYSDYDLLCSLKSDLDQKEQARVVAAPQTSQALAYWQTGKNPAPKKKITP